MRNFLGLLLLPACAHSERLVLVKADGGKEIQEIFDGDTIIYDEETMAIVAEFDPNDGRRVEFYNRGTLIRADYNAPWSLFGDDGEGNFFSGSLDEGIARMVVIKANFGPNERMARTFTVAYPPPKTFNRLFFVDPETNEDVQLIPRGDIPVSFEGEINIRAEFAEVGAFVEFVMDGVSVRNESLAPYALFGDNDGDYLGEVIAPGDYVLEAFLRDENGGVIRRLRRDIKVVAFGDEPNPCEGVTTFDEVDGLVVIEAESFPYQCSGDWEFSAIPQKDTTVAGRGYLTYKGKNSFGEPNPSQHLSVAVNINQAGTYKVFWRSFLFGDETTEHNDSWLKIHGGKTLLYGSKSNKDPNWIFPEGADDEVPIKGPPFPEGKSADGFFKIYRNSPEAKWTWQTSTSDFDAHNVYVLFDEPGTYDITLSARSRLHSIDRLVLHKIGPQQRTEADAQSLANIETRA